MDDKQIPHCVRDDKKGAAVDAVPTGTKVHRYDHLESHLREEPGQPALSGRKRKARVDEVVGLVRSYLK